MNFFNKKNKEKDISILQALIRRDRYLALELLIQGSDLQEQDEKGAVALHYAAALGYLDVIKKILNTGFQVNTFNNQGQTPLVYAMMYGQPEAARLLWQYQSRSLKIAGPGTLVRELCRIGVEEWTLPPDESSSGYFRSGITEKYEPRPEVVEIGQLLWRAGGLGAMREACHEVQRILGGKAMINLSCAFNGIGDWVD